MVLFVLSDDFEAAFSVVEGSREVREVEFVLRIRLGNSSADSGSRGLVGALEPVFAQEDHLELPAFDLIEDSLGAELFVEFFDLVSGLDALLIGFVQSFLSG